jgi:hydroxyethylthiazole kinase-like uncharacterized protein yjeF
MPLPEIDEAGDKNERGRVLIAGGSVETPGAVILAGIAALRGGAGRLRIATCQSIAPYIATSVPEARVFGVAETKSGSISSLACPRLAELAGSVDALSLGSGMIDDRLAVAVAKGLLKRVGETKIVIDAAALRGLTDNPTMLHQLKGQVVLTPHSGEMVALTGANEAIIRKHAMEIAREAAQTYHAVVTLKGRETFIAAPGGEVFVNRAGNAGLATSGSGDVLSGLITGFLARGAEPITAAVWGVHVHARAGDVLARQVGKVGYLAREIVKEIPGVIEALVQK